MTHTTHLTNSAVVLTIDYILHNSASYHALLRDPTTSPHELSSMGTLIYKEYHDRSSKVAQQPHTDPHPAAELDVLSALLSDIYRNPNTPLPTLLKVTASHIKDFLENPALHLHFLENTQFLSFLNYNAQEALIKATDDPALLSFPWKNYNTKLALANNPHTPVHILQNLAGDLYAAHRSAAASNPQMPADVLHLLRKLGGHRLLQGDAPDYRARFTDAEWEILLSIGPWSCRLVAQHPIGGPRFFDRLADDLNSYVRAGLLRNRAISEEKLLSLLQTKFPSHAQRSGYTLDTFLLNPTLSTKTVTSFLGYLSPRVRRRAMQHANVDQNIVKMLKYLCGDDKLRESHINQDSRFTDEEMLFLIELGPWPASLLAKHVHTPAHIFAALQQKSTTDQQFSILPSMFAANPSVPEEILTELVTAKTQWLSNVIANNPAMSVQIFRKIFDVTTSATYIKRSLVLHPHITDDPTLLAAIEHPSTTLRLSFSAEQNRSYATLVNESYAYKHKYKNINDPAHHKTQLSDADFAFFAQFFGKSDELSVEIISWMLIHPDLPLAQQHTAAREYPWARRGFGTKSHDRVVNAATFG